MSESECITELNEEVYRCAIAVGIDENKAKDLAKDVTKCLSFRWSGLNLYWKKNVSKKTKDTHEQILKEHTGSNVRLLAKKYDFSEQWIYNIIKKQREKQQEGRAVVPAYAENIDMFS